MIRLKTLSAKSAPMTKRKVSKVEKVHYWSDLADLTHTKQVEEFGFCCCEDNEGNEDPYDDCPTN